VFFDSSTGKHCLDIEFSEVISGIIEPRSLPEQLSANLGDKLSEPSATLGEARETSLRGTAGVNSVDNAGVFFGTDNQSVTVE
jgi:hypothetical protein